MKSLILPKHYRVIGLATIGFGIVIGLLDLTRTPQASELTSSETAEFASIKGHVKYENGTPASGISIYINHQGGGINNDGTYSLTTDLPTGHTSVRFYNTQTGQRYKLKGSHDDAFSYDPSAQRAYNFVIEEVLSTASSPSPSPSPVVTPTPIPDRIQTLRFTPATIDKGQTTKLEWAAHPVTFVEFNNNLGRKASSGSLFLTPDVTTTYIATATYSTGTQTKTESKSVTITVNQPSENVSAPPKPTNLAVTNDGTNILTLTWRNTGPTTTGYYIYRSALSNVASAEYIGQADRTSYTDTLSITDRSTYYYWVRSYAQGTNAMGVSEPSTPASITLNARLNTPTLTAKAATGTKIKLTWNRFTRNNVSENDSWELWRKAEGESDFTKHNEAYSPTTTRWTDNLRMKRNTRYYYKIRAYKTIRGERLYSDFSNEASAKS